MTALSGQPRGRAVVGRWRLIALVVAGTALIAVNVMGVATALQSAQVGVAPDYQQYADALGRFLAGDSLYVAESKWRYSPVALLTLGPGIALGLVGWTLLHLAAMLFVRPWPLAVVMALSWPFIMDVVAGNTVVFVAVAGIAAARGSSAGTYAYWWLTLTMPRPFQMPLAVLLARRRRDLRRGLLLMTAANVALIAAIGQGPEWVAYLLARGGENMTLGFNIHPAAQLGLSWLVIGIPAAAVLTWMSLPGLAGVVLFPSLLAQYLLLAFVDVGARFTPRWWRTFGAAPRSRAERRP